MRPESRYVAAAVALGVAVAVSFAAGREVRKAIQVRSQPESVPLEARPVPGSQLLVVYIGSSRCGPSNQQETVDAVRRILALLRARSIKAGHGFASIGIARELSAAAGLAHLSRIGPFDEIASGQGDFNQASVRFVSRDHPGIGATPQLIIVRRELSRIGSVVDNVSFSERVVVRKVGSADIRRWAQRGAPLPSNVWDIP